MRTATWGRTTTRLRQVKRYTRMARLARLRALRATLSPHQCCDQPEVPLGFLSVKLSGTEVPKLGLCLCRRSSVCAGTQKGRNDSGGSLGLASLHHTLLPPLLLPQNMAKQILAVSPRVNPNGNSTRLPAIYKLQYPTTSSLRALTKWTAQHKK